MKNLEINVHKNYLISLSYISGIEIKQMYKLKTYQIIIQLKKSSILTELLILIVFRKAFRYLDQVIGDVLTRF